MDTSAYLNLAAKLALRGHGGAEPNPMVGCVILSPAGKIVGWGYHRKVGGPHAERWALDRAGTSARGATLYVTLEPCNHTGRTGPCTEAIIAAGVKRVVFARHDPHSLSQGGEARLRSAGIEVERAMDAAFAQRLASPFVHRLETGLPWVIAKWAQSKDGKLALPADQGRWLSSERSRRMVHRERGRVDAILTGMGTVRADDPMLTVRHGRKRRTPRRIVIDPTLSISTESKLFSTIPEAPLTIVCAEDAADRAVALRCAGADVLAFPADQSRFVLEDVLRDLAQRYDITNLLVETGSNLLASLVQEKLINMLWVFVAPLTAGEDNSLPTIPGGTLDHLAQTCGMQLLESRTRAGDQMLIYGNESARP